MMQLKLLCATLNLMPNRPTSGFTLIEIIVSLTIIILLTALAIPNLSRFNEEQAIRSEADKFISVVRQAQTNAQARIQPDDSSYTSCPQGTELYWQVSLQSDTSYAMGWVCDAAAPTSTATFHPKLTVNLPSAFRLNSTNCAGYTTKKINFQTNAFSSSCPLSGGNLTFTFTNVNNSASTVTVTLNQGGSVYAN